MSEDKRTDAVELSEESLKKVDGGFGLKDLLHGIGIESEPEAETIPTGGKSFTIKSTIATGEKVGDVVQPQNGETDQRTGKRMPKVIFRDKGNNA